MRRLVASEQRQHRNDQEDADEQEQLGDILGGERVSRSVSDHDLPYAATRANGSAKVASRVLV